MSEGPELAGLEALAAEHALGVLAPAERAQAESRMASDPAFAADVEAWRSRLAPLIAAIAPVAPPAGLWPRIERALPPTAVANDNAVALRGLRFWRSAAVGSLGLLAASLVAVVMIASRPPTVIVAPASAPAPMLNASLTTQTGAPVPLFVAAYDPDRKALIITSLVQPGTVDPGHVHELWVIPADGKPRALGFVEPGKSKTIPMSRSLADAMAEGSAIAVSVEASGGSANPNAPTGPIAAVGKLAKI